VRLPVYPSILLAAVAQLSACAHEPGTPPGEAGEAGEAGESSTSGDGTETGDEPAPFMPEIGDDGSFVAFADAHVWFGEENHRQIDVALSLPAAELAYASVTLDLTLGCPNDRCDWWDRKGYIGLVRAPGTEQESIVEVARFMTPYRVGARHVIDVTELRPLLAGDVVLRVFIDTWVGPGHPNGDGWLVDARFDFVGGAPTRVPIAAIPLWDLRTVEYGDPAAPISESVPSVVVELPIETDAVALRSIITGHGQGNLHNCAEFCPRNHGFLIGEQPFVREIWRDDCAETPVEGQQGTWQYPRAGWCPGAEVIPWIEEVGAAAPAGASVTVTYDVQAYENTCRPDAPVCTGCALGTGCDYDGGNHTPPIYDISAMLIAYRNLGEV
jgi:hypothetical protein